MRSGWLPQPHHAPDRPLVSAARQEFSVSTTSDLLSGGSQSADRYQEMLRLRRVLRGLVSRSKPNRDESQALYDSTARSARPLWSSRLSTQAGERNAGD